MSFPTIALISDFGQKDGFAGVVKGVIYSMIQHANGLTANQPSPPIIDISHEITPHNIREAAWVLNHTHEDFPDFTVFVCIVDPKVGESSSKAVLLYAPERKQYFIAPDNGLLTPVIQAAGKGLKAWHIENSELFRVCNLSGRNCFLGRDIYAAMAGHLANALMCFSEAELLNNIGPHVPVTELKQIEWKHPSRDNGMIEGQVFHCDVFGNLITNIPNHWLKEGHDIEIRIKDHKLLADALLSRSVEDVSRQDKVYIVPTSGGTLEVMKFKKNAQEALHAGVGAPVTFYFQKPDTGD